MTLIYNGHGEGIAGVPARDLTDSEISKVAADWQQTVDETTQLLCSRGLYSHPAQPKKTKQAEPLSEPVDSEVIDDGSIQ
jgi:hypothetical protein